MTNRFNAKLTASFKVVQADRKYGLKDENFVGQRLHVTRHPAAIVTTDKEFRYVMMVTKIMNNMVSV